MHHFRSRNLIGLQHENCVFIECEIIFQLRNTEVLLSNITINWGRHNFVENSVRSLLTQLCFEIRFLFSLRGFTLKFRNRLFVEDNILMRKFQAQYSVTWRDPEK